MSKLLRADFARLWKSRIFWIGIAYTFVIGVLASTTPYRESLEIENYHPHFDNTLFTNCMFMPIVSAVFVGLFVGTDYSNGTIRNKLVVGHTRIAVYFSNLIVCVTAIIIMHLTNILTVTIIGAPLVGNREMPVDYLITLGLISIVTVIALSTVFLVMSMLINSKANASVGAIILSIIFLIAAMAIGSRLKEPEYHDTYYIMYTDESGETHEESGGKEKNPYYLTGMKREVFTFLYDFLPGCQMLQIAQQELDEPEENPLLPIYSLSIAVVTTACGVFFFRRKNLN